MSTAIITGSAGLIGSEFGLPVDRYSIENFLATHAEDVKERVLEIGDDSYTRQLGGDRVTTRDVLHVHENNPIVTLVGNLTHAEKGKTRFLRSPVSTPHYHPSCQT